MALGQVRAFRSEGTDGRMKTMQGRSLGRLRGSKEMCARFLVVPFGGVKKGSLSEHEIEFINDAKRREPTARMGTRAPCSEQICLLEPLELKCED